MTSKILENLINWLQYRKNRREFIGNLSRNLFYFIWMICEKWKGGFFGGKFPWKIQKECFKFSYTIFMIFWENKNPTIFFFKCNKIQSADDTALKISCSCSIKRFFHFSIFIFWSEEFSIELSRPKLDISSNKFSAFF